MEEKVTEPKTETIIHTAPPAKKAVPAGRQDPFSMIGKITAIVVIAIILLGGGIYLGKTMNKSTNSNPTAQVAPTAQPTSMMESPTSTPSANPPLIAVKPVSAGGVSGVSFSAYTINVPANWNSNDEKTAVSDKLTITKGSTSLTITQAAMGGGGCIYPGDKPAEMAQNFTDFVGITGTAGQFRRSFNKGNSPTISYTICQQASDGSYGSPTQFGGINAVAPSSIDQTTLTELDSMIASLTKK